VAAKYVFADFELEEQRFELRKHGRRVAIQPKELRLLLYLVRHRGRVVPKAELLEALWPMETVCGDSLKRAVRGLRRALGDDGAKQSRIRTVRGYGYEFVVPRRRATQPVASGAVHSA
jgi:DNA-binding winged helix-turn-helix (wHTH) protein